MKDIFVCPACHNDLKFDALNYSCQKCNVTWPLSNDIPRFAENEVPYSVFNEDIAENLVSDHIPISLELKIKYENEKLPLSFNLGVCVDFY